MPIFASFLSRSRRVEAGTLPKRDSSSTVARGVAHSRSSVSSKRLASKVGCQHGWFGSWPPSEHTLDGRDGPRCRIQDLHAVAHGVHDGAGQGAARVAPSQEPPEGVAGDAEGLRRLPDAPPQNVDPQVLADGVLKIGVERCASCPASLSLALKWSIDCSVAQWSNFSL